MSEPLFYSLVQKIMFTQLYTSKTVLGVYSTGFIQWCLFLEDGYYYVSAS